ncbi:hypothetical protein [Methylocaldum szegediense]|uniref:PEP-CTERM protein-sorting domain-containing protein n=1 Tax=Methylocaldum szegediense TaxID=73780 RepID=A0ABM9HW32_9GAMM|nr:hypothetical protein [Methylocaldum szegediense]CAI8725178.1 conserved exported protein of unknown function [Methylocaldum szegediense]
MKKQHLANIFSGTILSLLLVWSHGPLAEAFDDNVSPFDTSHHGKESSYFFIKPAPYIPHSDKALYTEYTEHSFFDLTKSSSGIPSVGRTAFMAAFNVSTNGSSNNLFAQESQASFREIQNALPTLFTLEGLKGRLREPTYAQYASSASEDETWFMILVGITLIGLQIFRSNKKAEPIYLSSH